MTLTFDADHTHVSCAPLCFKVLAKCKFSGGGGGGQIHTNTEWKCNFLGYQTTWVCHENDSDMITIWWRYITQCFRCTVKTFSRCFTHNFNIKTLFFRDLESESEVNGSHFTELFCFKFIDINPINDCSRLNTERGLFWPPKRSRSDRS